MKKLTILLLALLLALTVNASALTVSDENVFPIVDEPYELTIWMSPGATIEDMETNATTLWYEEKTGVHVNWIQVPAGETTTKFNLSISSGEYPDIYSTGFSTETVAQYSQAGHPAAAG